MLTLIVDAVLVGATLLALAGGSTGYEGQPGNQGNGQNGYEGQPGNQGGGGGNGLKGYEGQPGNQGG
jgi:hypothetical protein